MAEFKFSCPQCGQHVQCDTSYSGQQINCPICRKSIVVPQMQPAVSLPGADTIQIKKSTLKKMAVIALCVLIVAGIGALAIHVFAGPRKLTFKAYVDGTDVIKLNGKKLWIEHQAWQSPGKITVNGKKWSPSWHDNTSTTYDLHSRFNQRDPDKIKLVKLLGRGTVSIAELPTPANQETLAVKIDDGAYGGADWYEFVVSW